MTDCPTKFLTVREIVEGDDYPFTETQLRWWLARRQTNGLAEAVLRPSHRLYLNREKFDAWLADQTEERES